MKRLFSTPKVFSLSLLLALTLFAQTAHLMPFNGRFSLYRQAQPVPVTCPGEPAGDVCD